MKSKIIIFLLILTLFASGCISIVDNGSPDNEINKTEPEESKNKNTEKSKRNYSPQVFYLGNKQSDNRIKVKKYTNFSENILNNKSYRRVTVDKSFNKIQVIIDYGEQKDTVDKTKTFSIKDPSSEKVTQDYPQADIDELGGLMYYKIDDPMSGEWVIKTDNSTEIESVKKYSPYQAELNMNYTYRKGQSIPIDADVYLSTETDTKIKDIKLTLIRGEFVNNNVMETKEIYFYDLYENHTFYNDFGLDTEHLKEGYYTYEYSVTLNNSVKFSSTKGSFFIE